MGRIDDVGEDNLVPTSCLDVTYPATTSVGHKSISYSLVVSLEDPPHRNGGDCSHFAMNTET